MRRVEVITGTGRRRRFSESDKARIVDETLAPGVVVSAVARRHGLTPQQLFEWRRLAREGLAEAVKNAPPLFAPVVVDQKPAATRMAAPLPAPTSERRASARSKAAIEVEVAGVVVRVARGADARTIAAVLKALKAGA